MRWKSTAMTLLVVVATTASVFIGSRAIVSAASTLKSNSTRDAEERDEFDATSEQVAELLSELSADSAVGVELDDPRDPLLAVKPQRDPSVPAAPRPPSYKVTAVFIDADPRAIVVTRGKAIVVRLGDKLNGAPIIDIHAGGVTVDTGSGTKTYPLSPPKR